MTASGVAVAVAMGLCPGAAAHAGAAEPLEKVVHEVPRRLPGGGQVRPRLMLDATRLLLSAGKSLYVRHLRSGKTVKLADVPLPKGTTLFPAGFTVGNGRIAWWTARTARGGKKRTADFWAVPVGGGTVRRVASAVLPPPSRAGLVTGLAVTPKGLAWSAGDDGVFVAAGGAVKRVEGTRGRHLLSWPWAGSPGPSDPRQTPYQSVKNVETGETRRAPGPGSAVACGVTRCIVRADGSFSARVLGRDGRAQGAVDATGMPPQPLLRDRFAVAYALGRALVHDVTTKTAVVVEGVDTGTRYRTAPGDDLVVFRRGDKYVIVDLAAVK
ncbi:hypothetical protein ACFFR3_37750 [Nonomuraea salmonea]|uniref:WD40 repeat domain-containing protein n=1 Tax=Nonomuraea salmonea TaxID=46181 RepID=A0ABV5NY75_9ACTN